MSESKVLPENLVPPIDLDNLRDDQKQFLEIISRIPSYQKAGGSPTSDYDRLISSQAKAALERNTESSSNRSV